MKGIPTLYKGVQYRSRLEAKWAAMFDLLGWRAEYEPFDLPGWIPDFALIGESTVLVEVKPFFTLEEFYDSGTIEKNLRAMANTPYAKEHLLLVGASLGGSGASPESEDYDGTVLGWVGGCEEEFANAIIVYDEIYDFFSETGAWYGHMGIQGSGKKLWRDTVSSENLLKLWAQATNATQWKKPRATTPKPLKTTTTPRAYHKYDDLSDYYELDHRARERKKIEQEMDALAAQPPENLEDEYDEDDYEHYDDKYDEDGSRRLLKWVCDTCGDEGVDKPEFVRVQPEDFTYPKCPTCGDIMMRLYYWEQMVDYGKERKRQQALAAAPWSCRSCTASGTGKITDMIDPVCSECGSKDINIDHPELGSLEYPCPLYEDLEDPDENI